MINYQNKYLKYKQKYLKAKNMKGGDDNSNNDGSKIIPVIDLYQYDIIGYEFGNDKKNAGYGDQYQFDGILSKKDGECGKISIYNANSGKPKSDILSKCDVIDSCNGVRKPGVDIYKKPTKPTYYDELMFYMIDIYNNSESRVDRLFDMPRTTYNRYKDDFRGTLQYINHAYKNKYGEEEKKEIDKSYIQKVDISNIDCKVVIIGNIGGSFHTFIRLLYRYHCFGILDISTLKLKAGYKLIFLGNVVGDGNLCLEIILIIFEMILVNNIIDKVLSDDPKIYFIRGKNEEADNDRNHKFATELKNKSGSEDLSDSILGVFSYFPSAIILKKNDHQIWLSQGGFPYYSTGTDVESVTLPSNGWSGNILKLDLNQSYIVRRSGFSSTRNINTSKPYISHYDPKLVYEFLKANNLNFIIRGDQTIYDYNNSNSYLLSNIIDDKLQKNNFDIGTQKNKSYNGILFYNAQQYVNPIARISCEVKTDEKGDMIMGEKYKEKVEFTTRSNNQDQTKTIVRDENKVELYPVLTLSTNTNRRINLSSDSFALLKFDTEKKDVKNFGDILQPTVEIPYNTCKKTLTEKFFGLFK